MILIADSGSTKTDWRAVNRYGSVKGVTTAGINPVFMDEDRIFEILEKVLIPSLPVSEKIEAVYFYGAGVVDDERAAVVCGALQKAFPDAECEAASDLLAAARALCGREAGVVCIIGTGSNSCKYDGEGIEMHVGAGGFILGDEGSGAWLGKRLVSDYVKGLLPTAIRESFDKKFALDYPTIVSRVYKEPMPGAFLASFAPFIADFKNHPYVKSLLKEGFESFLSRNVMQYDCKNREIHFAGSVAFYFKEALVKALLAGGMKPGRIVRKPMDGLIKYHTAK